MASIGTEHDASRFSQSCDKWADYPTNLVHPLEFEHELASYQSILNDSKVKLFHPNPKKRLLRMLSLETGSEGESRLELRLNAWYLSTDKDGIRPRTHVKFGNKSGRPPDLDFRD